MATREELLAATFLQLADTLVDDFDVVELLTMLSDRCVELLGAAATGIMVADASGHLQVMAASSEDANLLELFQIQNGEGPCLDAFRSGQPIAHANLGQGSSWPRFGQLAMGAALPSVHAFPMRVRTHVLGTLNLFIATPMPLSDADVVVAQALAHAATLALLHNEAAQDSQRLTAQLHGALNSRVTIEQAKGAIAERAHIGTDEAFVRLRHYARGHNLKLTDVATAVVTRTLPDHVLARLATPTTASDPPGPPAPPAAATDTDTAGDPSRLVDSWSGGQDDVGLAGGHLAELVDHQHAERLQRGATGRNGPPSPPRCRPSGSLDIVRGLAVRGFKPRGILAGSAPGGASAKRPADLRKRLEAASGIEPLYRALQALA